MSLDGNFLDLKKQKHQSTFGIASTGIAIAWCLLFIIPIFTTFYRSSFDLIYYLAFFAQFIGTILAIISIRKNETRRILYLIGLIVNGIGFLYFGLTMIL